MKYMDPKLFYLLKGEAVPLLESEEFFFHYFLFMYET